MARLVTKSKPLLGATPNLWITGLNRKGVGMIQELEPINLIINTGGVMSNKRGCPFPVLFSFFLSGRSQSHQIILYVLVQVRLSLCYYITVHISGDSGAPTAVWPQISCAVALWGRWARVHVSASFLHILLGPWHCLTQPDSSTGMRAANGG